MDRRARATSCTIFEPGGATATTEPYDWANRFNETIKRALTEHDHQTPVNYLALGDDARLSAPTPEHYLPLHSTFWLSRRQGEALTFFNDRVESSISMLGVQGWITAGFGDT